MAEQRLTQQVVEVLITIVPAARVTQEVVEVLTNPTAAPPVTTRQPIICIVS